MEAMFAVLMITTGKFPGIDVGVFGGQLDVVGTAINNRHQVELQSFEKSAEKIKL